MAPDSDSAPGARHAQRPRSETLDALVRRAAGGVGPVGGSGSAVAGGGSGSTVAVAGAGSAATGVADTVTSEPPATTGIHALFPAAPDREREPDLPAEPVAASQAIGVTADASRPPVSRRALWIAGGISAAVILGISAGAYALLSSRTDSQNDDTPDPVADPIVAMDLDVDASVLDPATRTITLDLEGRSGYSVVIRDPEHPVGGTASEPDPLGRVWLSIEGEGTLDLTLSTAQLERDATLTFTYEGDDTPALTTTLSELGVLDELTGAATPTPTPEPEPTPTETPPPAPAPPPAPVYPQPQPVPPPAPVDPAPVDPAPVDPAPVDPGPVEPEPTVDPEPPVETPPVEPPVTDPPTTDPPAEDPGTDPSAEPEV